MPSIGCPLEDCDYRTEDAEAAVCVELLKIHATIHSTNTSTTAKVEKVKRPTISAAGTSEEWQYFESRWTDYCDATKITGKDKVVQLLECCDEQLRKDLTRNAGGSLANKSEGDVLAAIKRLAVREENCMVARVQLHNMCQDRDETIRSFGARIRGQAGVCKFTIKCTSCDAAVNYTDAILRDVLTRGISDPEIQVDLLGDKNQDMSLEEMFQFIEAKESGKRSATRLLDHQGVDAAGSSYRKEKKNTLPPKVDVPCGYCGKKGHGKSAPPGVRKKSCSAFDHKCIHCGLRNHFDHMCRKKEQSKTSKSLTNTTDIDECEGAVFDTLCAVSTFGQHKGRRTLNLDHHLYDNLCDRWVRQPSKPQPFIRVKACVDPQDYDKLGFTLNTEPKTRAI